jgi:hypothetical protein
MKIYKLYVYSAGEEYYLKTRASRDKKVAQLKEKNKHDIYEVSVVEVSK